eukprot:CAMPEP_0175066112 /NCGR_PEP_ID=MMETSP0052_2-20121109/16318_1 /TAXON_ID=51329 ORGANISM="Polytomella parva, Strain SAG 63-3" /NCGR_SAMPLE_ID=MMETSP0052_2 /ASSEMBLY_ACC=CAM_ASM_000194 /LENGTH=466 /DNA_ID=CAMNT_0016332759 /DNA_START=227 /DNA_END=1624 /DNA_ORIENTATION=-
MSTRNNRRFYSDSFDSTISASDNNEMYPHDLENVVAETTNSLQFQQQHYLPPFKESSSKLQKQHILTESNIRENISGNAPNNTIVRLDKPANAMLGDSPHVNFSKEEARLNDMFPSNSNFSSSSSRNYPLISSVLPNGTIHGPILSDPGSLSREPSSSSPPPSFFSQFIENSSNFQNVSAENSASSSHCPAVRDLSDKLRDVFPSLPDSASSFLPPAPPPAAPSRPAAGRPIEKQLAGWLTGGGDESSGSPPRYDNESEAEEEGEEEAEEEGEEENEDSVYDEDDLYDGEKLKLYDNEGIDEESEDEETEAEAAVDERRDGAMEVSMREVDEEMIKRNEGLAENEEGLVENEEGMVEKKDVNKHGGSNKTIVEEIAGDKMVNVEEEYNNNEKRFSESQVPKAIIHSTPTVDSKADDATKEMDNSYIQNSYNSTNLISSGDGLSGDADDSGNDDNGNDDDDDDGDDD